MSVSVKNLQTYGVHIKENVKDRNWRSHQGLIALAEVDPFPLY